MLAIVSPSKSLKFENQFYQGEKFNPTFEKETMELISILKKYSKEDISKLMKISEKLSELNYNRYQDFGKKYTEENSNASVNAFTGDVYTGLDAATLSENDFEYAKKHFRILSGLYGLLAPHQKIQPYRLEMGTKLPNENGNTLYKFWGDKITDQLNKDLKNANTNILLNLASEEYFKAVNKQKLDAKIINVDFREERDGKLKFISFNAKKARGYMSRFMIQHQIQKVGDLRGFDTDGYLYNEEGSTEDKLLFIR